MEAKKQSINVFKTVINILFRIILPGNNHIAYIFLDNHI